MSKKRKTMLDLTPIVDIVFILIVFLLLTQNIPLNNFGINVPVATTKNQNTSPENEYKIYIFKEDGRFTLDGDKIEGLNAFENTVVKLPKDGEITLIVEASSSAGNLISVMEILNKQGFTKISFTTQSK